MNTYKKFIAFPNSMIMPDELYPFKAELLVMYYEILRNKTMRGESYFVMADLYNLCNVPRPKSTPGKMANWKHFLQALDYLVENHYVELVDDINFVRWEQRVKLNTLDDFQPKNDFTLIEDDFCQMILFDKSAQHNEEIFVTFCYMSRFFCDQLYFKPYKIPKVFFGSKLELSKKLHMSIQKMNAIMSFLCHSTENRPILINRHMWTSDNHDKRRVFYSLNKECYANEVKRAYEYLETYNAWK